MAEPSSATSTQNACKLCTPLGACLAFRGIEGTLPFLHGSQGCATYIRRYLIGHYREPMDIGCSSFGEDSAIFGGAANLHEGLNNVSLRYQPRVIGVASTCLSETIGDDLSMFIHQYKTERQSDEPHIIPVSTPSYKGTHADGFYLATQGVVKELADGEAQSTESINVFPSMATPADLRYLHEVLTDFGIPYVLLPDYSESLDRPIVSEYEPIPPGGTPLASIRGMGSAMASLTLSKTVNSSASAGSWLHDNHEIPHYQLAWPIGIEESDLFFESLEKLSGSTRPAKHTAERGRLIDSYVDAHKYVFGKRAVVYGEEDLVVGVALFLNEIGVKPVVCASGGRSGRMRALIEAQITDTTDMIIAEGVDFVEIREAAEAAQPDFLIGNSRGYWLARQLSIPIIRIGFPIQDRIGGQRILHIGYRGTQWLFDQVVNTLIECKQESSPVGYLTL